MSETDDWVVEHSVGPLGVGTLIVKPRRHVVHVAELSETEAAELGPLLRRTAATVTRLLDPEQVYVTLWSHAGGVAGNIHWVVQPVTRDLMTRYGLHGPRLQVAMFADEPASEDLGYEIRDVLTAAWVVRIESLATGVGEPSWMEHRGRELIAEATRRGAVDGA